MRSQARFSMREAGPPGRTAATVPAGLPPIASRVFEVLAFGEALAACELMRRVSAVRAAPTPLVSIYRALARLRSRGLVVQSVISKRWALRDRGLAEPALLLACRRCGSILQADARSFAGPAAALGEGHGFRVAQAHLEAAGICARCRRPDGSPGCGTG
jgi:Fur family transcriptional regulator, zinc uptake regulator